MARQGGSRIMTSRVRSWNELTEEDLENIFPGLADELRKKGWVGPEETLLSDAISDPFYKEYKDGD